MISKGFCRESTNGAEWPLPKWADSNKITYFSGISCFQDRSAEYGGSMFARCNVHYKSRVHFEDNYVDNSIDPQYMATDFLGYMKEYYPEIINESWDADDLRSALLNDDTGHIDKTMRDSYGKLANDCSVKCWHHDECLEIYTFLRKHTPKSDLDTPDITNSVKGYADLIEFRGDPNTLVFYCHLFGERGSGGHYVEPTEDPIPIFKSSPIDDICEYVDGDMIATHIWYKQDNLDLESTERKEFCGRNQCLYAPAIEEYLDGDEEPSSISDPLNKKLISQDPHGKLSKYLISEMTYKGAVLSELQSKCMASNTCLAIDFDFTGHYRPSDGSRLYDGTLYRFLRGHEHAAWDNFNAQSGIHLKSSTYFDNRISDDGGMMLRLQKCRNWIGEDPPKSDLQIPVIAPLLLRDFS